MKNKFIIIIAVLFSSYAIMSCSTAVKEESTDKDSTKTEKVAGLDTEVPGVNTLSDKEKADGWMLLFDGATANGWKGYNKETFPAGWKIEDGTIHCPGSGRGEAGGEETGDIIYDKIYGNFHLKLEWKISEAGNSGVFYLGQNTHDFIWKTAPEMQILDNAKHPDAEAGKDGNRQAGSLYDLIPAKPQNAKPAGEWNSIEIKVFKGSVWHYQNGEVILEYHLWTPEWNKLVAESKFPDLNANWAKVAAEGYIGLQDHGDDVWFRNIRIKEL